MRRSALDLHAISVSMISLFSGERGKSWIRKVDYWGIKFYEDGLPDQPENISTLGENPTISLSFFVAI